jgi:signal transduction histidine kinase
MSHKTKAPFNNRVLVIDDEETIRDSFREILVPRKRNGRGLTRASSDLFGDGPAPPGRRSAAALLEFDLTEAATGPEGLEKVREAVAADMPFAAIFVDMRMPGWDGLKTVEMIREIDPRSEIVFVTAYSDFAIDEVVQRAGMNVSYHCKPFSVEEIRQIATKAVYEWNKARNLEDLIGVISHIRSRRWELAPLLRTILRETAGIVSSDTAMLAEPDETSGKYRYLMGIGDLAAPDEAGPWLEKMGDLREGGDAPVEPSYAWFTVGRYRLLTLLDAEGPSLDRERVYLVQLFLEQAALAIENVDLQERVIRQEKLSAIGQAISMVAHDLRGPIGAICQGIQFLESAGDAPDVLADMHRMILKEARHCLAIVTDILDFTRNTALNKTLVDAGLLVMTLQEQATALLAETGVSFRVRGETEVEFPADESKVRRILLNLIRNAAEALHEAGIPDPRIDLTLERDGDHLLFRVSDNGPGIPESIRDRLFLPFVTVGKTGGTGLGLAIVDHFATAHGGTVDYRSSPRGTVFTVRLPKA